MSNFGFDPFWRWLDSQSPPEDLPDFRVRPVDVTPMGVPGLAGWQPPVTATAQPAPESAPFATDAASQTWWERSTDSNGVFEGGSESYWPWLRAPIDDVPGFRLNPDGSVRSDKQGGDVRLMAGALAPVDVTQVGVPGLHRWQPPATGAAPFAPANALDGTESAPRPWWECSTGPSNVLEGEPQLHWPWLHAPTDEVSGFRLKPEESVQTGESGGNVRLMAGALAPLESQGQLNDVAGSNGTTSSDIVPTLPPGAPPSTISAASIALPAIGGGAVDLAALAARAAPALADAIPALTGAGSAAAGALPFLFIPTNTQSETTDLSDGLRARVRPGQRTVEIERRVEKGLFGTSFGAKWETLPVEAQQVVGSDGSVNTVINHEQLNRALGRSAPVESKAGTSAMAQPPKDGEPQQQPPDGIAPAADANNTGSAPAAQSLAPAKIDAKVLEEAKQRDPEEERLLACRAVRATPGQPAPPGQYGGRGGIDTAVGIRVAPGFPAPKGGYDYGPDNLRHWNGYKGELELKNRIEKAVPYEKFVHYGNPAGDQGPDVLTIGPDGRFMEWDSRSRMAKRRLGPSMAGSTGLEPEGVKIYVWNAIVSRAIAPDAGARALQELTDGNYNICTVGTGNAYDGYFESVRNGTSTGPRR
jgi:hypothetical protein